MAQVPSLKEVRLDQPGAKRAFNRAHFAAAASRYDFATKALSLGGDARWKRRLIEALPGRAGACLDLACGTGDVAFLLAAKFPAAQIEGLDLSREMLAVAGRRKTLGDRIRLVEGDLDLLPQPSASVDVVTGAYALRNAPDLRQALSEIHRVLTPGGTAAFLDFSKPDSGLGQKIQYGLLQFWGGLWGLLLHGNRSVHGYIAASLRIYPARSQLDELFRACGFEKKLSRRFYGGMVELTLWQK